MNHRTYNFHATDAVRESILLRAGLCGPAGCGKCLGRGTGLILGTRFVERLGLGPLYVIDAENRSALRYAYSPRSRQGYRFKHVPLPEDDRSPAAYSAALDYCESQGAGVILIDSLTHAWDGINGVLEQVDQITERSRAPKGAVSEGAVSEGWKVMGLVQKRLLQRILGSSAHIIFTVRAKTGIAIETDARAARSVVRYGLEPIQQANLAYEPDLFFDMTVPDNNLIVTKSRCDRLTPGEVVRRPGVEFADVLIEWAEDSDPPTEARTLGEAINQAVAEGICAAEERSAERYKGAKRKLLGWCENAGINAARREWALQHFKERVALVAGPRSPNAAGVVSCGVPANTQSLLGSLLSDEDRARNLEERRP